MSSLVEFLFFDFLVVKFLENVSKNKLLCSTDISLHSVENLLTPAVRRLLSAYSRSIINIIF